MCIIYSTCLDGNHDDSNTHDNMVFSGRTIMTPRDNRYWPLIGQLRRMPGSVIGQLREMLYSDWPAVPVLSAVSGIAC